MDLGHVLLPRFVEDQLGPLVLADGYRLTQQLGLESQQMGQRQYLDAAVVRKAVSVSACALSCRTYGRFPPFSENKFIAENPRTILGHGGGRKRIS